MSKKIIQRRERKIQEAVQADDWSALDLLLQQELSNAERRDRYHNRRIKDGTIATKKAKQNVRFDTMPSTALSPEEALILKELKLDIAKAKASLTPLDRDIVEMIAEQGLSYRETARRISAIHGKVSDITVKNHYIKTCDKLASYLQEYLY